MGDSTSHVGGRIKPAFIRSINQITIKSVHLNGCTMRQCPVSHHTQLSLQYSAHQLQHKEHEFTMYQAATPPHTHTPKANTRDLQSMSSRRQAT